MVFMKYLSKVLERLGEGVVKEVIVMLEIVRMWDCGREGERLE